MPLCIHRNFCRTVGAVLMVVAAVPSLARASDPAPATSVPNANLDQGDQTPAGWTLSGGMGRWVDRQILELTGTGNDTNEWHCDCPVVPGQLYRFEMRARSVGGAVSATSGASFANQDQPLSEAWTWYGHVFRAPGDATSASIRVGQWCAKGTLQFDAVRVAPVTAVHKNVETLQLGDGEAIHDGRYGFQCRFLSEGRNCSRTLASATAGFNSNRWCFDGKGQVTYRFELPGHAFRSGKLHWGICHYVRGGCVVEVSRDGTAWRQAALSEKLGVASADVPADLLPADVLYVRLRGATNDGSFQVDSVGFAADVTNAPPNGVGRTVFVEMPNAGRRLAIESIVMDDSTELNRPILRVTAKNRSDATIEAIFSERAVPRQPTPDQSRAIATSDASGFPVKFAPGQTQTFETPVLLSHGDENQVRAALRATDGETLAMTLPWTLPVYYQADYGQRIETASGPNDVWWCEATWKVAPQRPLPETAGPAATLSAARNDREAVQVVVRPKQALKGLTAAAGALTASDGATIPAENIKIMRVYYHNVQVPTDATSTPGPWPDALPPLDKPLDLPAGKNQPLWVLVHVPKDAKPGDYAGQLTLKAQGWSAVVPLRLHVWNFSLPERNHIETAFGLSMGRAFDYQKVKTEADRRHVTDLYLQNFAEHRISPYDPTPLDPIRVKFLPEANPPRAELDFTAFDAAMGRAVEKHHFTGFRLPIEGMRGGTFEGRSEGKIGQYGEHTPQYQAMFASYLKQLEDHLREKGWLNMAYTYWFDEPEPKDYAFVCAGMERLKRCAPGIATMLTEQPEKELAGSIDIWCPISPEYRQSRADERRQQGERFWWYVCCGPKAPYCTLFIDHPATDLRVWLWQTWQRNIVGILVWESNWWTSRGDVAQNPYDDPMGYVGGSRPEEMKYWGNGDGRFIYPPLAAAAPGISGDKPVIERPVSSIRWEMLREGIEDYEYLWLLRDLIGKKRSSLSADEIKAYESLLEVPETITTDAITFTTDPRPIYARRAAIAEAIERLVK